MTKSKEMEDMLNQIATEVFGRNRTMNQCVSCGKTVDIEKDFRDDLSRREYTISYMCQECQDSVFGAGCVVDDDEIYTCMICGCALTNHFDCPVCNEGD